MTTKAVLPQVRIIQGDALAQLKALPHESVNCCVSSPPYWGLRDYGVAGQLGLEKTPEEYVAKLVAVFSEVKRALRDDGTLWLNLGDSYARQAGDDSKKPTDTGFGEGQKTGRTGKSSLLFKSGNNVPPKGLKPKDLIGIPWLVAFALRADGWYLRSDIIWAKANCMPESVTDRPTRSHEFIFLLSKSQRYHYDHEAIKEPCIYDVDRTGTEARKARQHDGNKAQPTEKMNGIRAGGYKNSVNFDGKNKGAEKHRGHSRRHAGFNDRWDNMEKEEQCTGMRNKRDVWNVAPACYPEAHFATFPPDLIKPCILAGCPVGGTVLDPFGGSGTTGQVALELGRNAMLIELNPEYCELAKQRTNITPGLHL